MFNRGRESTGNGRNCGHGKADRHLRRPNIGSRVNREVHARFWERLGVKFPRATRRVSRTHPQRKEMWNCMRDEGGPLDAGSQVQAPNHCKLLPLRAVVVSVAAKGGT